MYDIEEAIDSKEFNEAFWVWFDDLPQQQRKLFDYHRSDMAKIYFFNAVWRKR